MILGYFITPLLKSVITIFNNPIVKSVLIYFHPFDLPRSLLVDAAWSPPSAPRSGGAAEPKDGVRFPTRMRQRAQKCKRSWWLWCRWRRARRARDGLGWPGSVLVLEQKGRDQNLDHMTGERNIQLYQGLLNVPFWVYWTSPYSSHYRLYT